MKEFIIILFSSFFLFTNNIYSQTVEDEIKYIRTHYLKVNNELDKYKKIDFINVGLFKDSNPYSMEGAKLFNLAIINCYKYFKDNKIKKIVVTFDGEYNFQTSEYYIWNDKLFFVFKKQIQFLKSRTSENLTGKDKTIIENRYYIKNNKIIRWLNEKKKKVLDKVKIKSEEKILIHDYELYRSDLSKLQ